MNSHRRPAVVIRRCCERGYGIVRGNGFYSSANKIAVRQSQTSSTLIYVELWSLNAGQIHAGFGGYEHLLLSSEIKLLVAKHALIYHKIISEGRPTLVFVKKSNAPEKSTTNAHVCATSKSGSQRFIKIIFVAKRPNRAKRMKKK